MGVMTRTYTVPKKSFLRQTARGFWIGSTFTDHGRTMKIVAVGQVRKDGRERLIDVIAEPLQEAVRKPPME